MPYFKTMEEWHTQSSLLLQARPSTARITTSYSISPPKPPRVRSSKPSTSDNASPPPQPKPDAETPAPTTTPTALLTLKTYDPVSGVCLKYKTNKGAEVGRLIGSLGRLGRTMAALPEGEETVLAGGDDGDAAPEEAKTLDTGNTEGAAKSSDVAAKSGEGKGAPSGTAGGGGGGGGGGGKKKKKGKR